MVITGHGLKDPASAETARAARRCTSKPTRTRSPKLRARMIVRAPATSANIGPGFDCAAVAFELWNELEVTDGDGVSVEGEGVGEIAADASNLAVRAYALLADPAGKHFRFTNRIPPERGLGSSAAAIALGLAAAAPATAPLEQLLAAGLELESHSDNLAAALLGGLSITWDGHATRIAETLPLHAVAVIPRARTSTAASRGTLPAMVAHADAAATAARAALLGSGAAAGDAELFAAALWDRLHEPYRPSAELTSIRAELPPGCAGRHVVRLRPDRDRVGLGRTRLRDRIARAVPAPRGDRARSCPEGSAVNVRLVDCPATSGVCGRAHSRRSPPRSRDRAERDRTRCGERRSPSTAVDQRNWL